MKGRLPSFRVMRETESGELAQMTWPDGLAMWFTGLNEDMSRAAAVEVADECQAAEPDARFYVVDPSGVVCYEASSVLCPF